MTEDAKTPEEAFEEHLAKLKALLDEVDASPAVPVDPDRQRRPGILASFLAAHPTRH